MLVSNLHHGATVAANRPGFNRHTDGSLRRAQRISGAALPLIVVATILGTLTTGCERNLDAATPIIRRAISARCLLFPEEFLTGHGLPACPFPPDLPVTALPCAIERYLGDDPTPRAIRRLQYDGEGRISRYSDHRGQRVVDARKVAHSRKDRALETQHYAELCSTPTPKYLYQEVLTYDADDRLVSVLPEFLAPQRLTYSYMPSWFSDELQVHVNEDRLVLELNSFGHVVAVQRRGQAQQPVDLSVRNGKIVEASWRERADAPEISASYAYQGTRLLSITLRSEGLAPQHYRFRYECSSAPVCASGPAATPQPIGQERSAISWDPDLRQFEARNCSDQHTYGPRLCGPVHLPHPNLQARCCNTDKTGLQVELHSALADTDITALSLNLPGGERLSSTNCRGRKRLSDCRFDREALLKLPASKAGLQIRTELGVVETFNVHTSWFIDAAR